MVKPFPLKEHLHISRSKILQEHACIFDLRLCNDELHKLRTAEFVVVKEVGVEGTTGDADSVPHKKGRRGSLLPQFAVLLKGGFTPLFEFLCILIAGVVQVFFNVEVGYIFSRTFCRAGRVALDVMEN